RLGRSLREDQPARGDEGGPSAGEPCLEAHRRIELSAVLNERGGQERRPIPRVPGGRGEQRAEGLGEHGCAPGQGATAPRAMLWEPRDRRHTDFFAVDRRSSSFPGGHSVRSSRRTTPYTAAFLTAPRSPCASCSSPPPTCRRASAGW